MMYKNKKDTGKALKEGVGEKKNKGMYHLVKKIQNAQGERVSAEKNEQKIQKIQENPTL